LLLPLTMLLPPVTELVTRVPMESAGLKLKSKVVDGIWCEISQILSSWFSTVLKSVVRLRNVV